MGSHYDSHGMPQYNTVDVRPEVWAVARDLWVGQNFRVGEARFAGELNRKARAGGMGWQADWDEALSAHRLLVEQIGYR